MAYRPAVAPEVDRSSTLAQTGLRAAVLGLALRVPPAAARLTGGPRTLNVQYRFTLANQSSTTSSTFSDLTPADLLQALVDLHSFLVMRQRDLDPEDRRLLDAHLWDLYE
jgi:hypothetical protein